MENFTYISDEGIAFDETDTMNFIRWKVSDLKKEGYSNEDIEEFILSDESIVGDIKELEQFVNWVLREGNKYFDV